MPSKYSDLEGGEQTPSLNGGASNVPKQKKAIPKSLQSKLDNKGNEKCWICMMISCIIICISISSLIIYMIVNYYIDTYEERDIIDNKISIISEQLIDYTTNTQVNCSNINPCSEWNCKYIFEHFHRTPDECEYDDYLTLVTTILIIFGVLICCHTCFG